MHLLLHIHSNPQRKFLYIYLLVYSKLSLFLYLKINRKVFHYKFVKTSSKRKSFCFNIEPCLLILKIDFLLFQGLFRSVINQQGGSLLMSFFFKTKDHSLQKAISPQCFSTLHLCCYYHPNEDQTLYKFFQNRFVHTQKLLS